MGFQIGRRDGTSKGPTEGLGNASVRVRLYYVSYNVNCLKGIIGGLYRGLFRGIL